MYSHTESLIGCYTDVMGAICLYYTIVCVQTVFTLSRPAQIAYVIVQRITVDMINERLVLWILYVM